MRCVPALETPSAGPRVIAFLGSTIGNLQPAEVHAFLMALRQRMQPTDALLLGTDLVKSAATLEAAYDGRAGVTAQFNLNVLRVINRELGGDFELGQFRHEAAYNPLLEQVELRLRTRAAQLVRIDALETEIPFQAGESILTEISRKFTHGSVRQMYADSGFRLRRWWEDADGWYGLSLASPT